MPVYLSPTYRVVNTINGTLSSGLADSLSNIYVAGSYGSSSAIMNQPSGPSSYSFPATLGGTAGSLIKLSPYGTVLYRTYVDGTGQDSDSFVNIDSQGNVYITGTYGGVAANVYYSNTSNVSNIIPSSNVYFPTTNQICGFVVKTLSNGFPLWRTYVCPNLGASSSSVTSTCTTTDSNSNVYMCGTILCGLAASPVGIYYSNVSNVSNIIQSSISFTTFSQGYNAFVTRLDSTGNPIANAGVYVGANPASNVVGNSVLVDSQSNIYLVCTISAPGQQYITSNSGGSGTLPSLIAPGSGASIVSFYGNCQYRSYAYVSNIFSPSTVTGLGSNIDSSSNLYICGAASNTCTFYGSGSSLVTPGSVQNTAGYVVKCSPSFLFYFRVYVDGPGTEVCTSVATDPLYSNIFIGGTYGTSGATAYGASSGTLTLPPTSGNQGGYIIRYDNTGTPIWQVTLSGASGVNINSVTVDSSQTSYITGSYGPGSVILYDTLNSNTILPAQASTTGFSLKLDVNGAIVFTGFTGLGTLSGAITGAAATTGTITVLFSTTNTNTDDTVTIYQASTLNGTPTSFGAPTVLVSSGIIACSPTAGYYIFLIITSTLGGTYTSSAFGPIAYGSIQQYPPIALTAGTQNIGAGVLTQQQFTTSISGQSYGNGTYVTSSSSTDNTLGSDAPWCAFNKVTGGAATNTIWNANGNFYSTTSPYLYNKSTPTTTSILGIGSVGGEWLQIQLPFPIILTSYTLQVRSDGYFAIQAPGQWYIVGSNNGSTWSNIQQITTTSWTAGSQVNTFTPTNSTPYSYYRIVITNGYTSGPGSGFIAIGDWALFGY